MVKARAQTLEQARERQIALSETAETRHHWLTAAAALLEIGIGVSSVSIITRNRWFWIGALALGRGRGVRVRGELDGLNLASTVAARLQVASCERQPSPKCLTAFAPPRAS